MPRKPRFCLPGVPAHIVQRGNARQAIFVDVTDHVRLPMTPVDADSISRKIQHVRRTYVTCVNRKYQRGGTLWQGHHKGSSILLERYAVTCCRHIGLNPVRVDMTTRPSEYRWSSYRANVFGESTDWYSRLPEKRHRGCIRKSDEGLSGSCFIRALNQRSLTRFTTARSRAPRWATAHFMTTSSPGRDVLSAKAGAADPPAQQETRVVAG